MRILVTGANGFIGTNLVVQLGARNGFEILRYERGSSIQELKQAIAQADFICHLAGVNRPQDDNEFARVNTDLTRILCRTVRSSGRAVPIIFASSVHALRDNLYGISKLHAEEVLLQHSRETGSPVYIFRLPHVVGKWCRPNYNSVVATFCYNIARELSIQIDNPAYPLQIVYIDDLVESFAHIINGDQPEEQYCTVSPNYSITVGELAALLRTFKDGRKSLVTERVGTELTRVLYATYISYLPREEFSYPVPKYGDPRGIFVEMLKTKDSGQFSYFTAHPGVTRGSHYHHSKTEKFLVIKGKALFRFRHIITNEFHEVSTSGDQPQIVETIPGWTHDITNVGHDELIVMLWANEIFDRARPDTYACPV